MTKTEVWKEKLAWPDGKLSLASFRRDSSSSGSGNSSDKKLKLTLVKSFVYAALLAGVARAVVGVDVLGEVGLAAAALRRAVDVTPVRLTNIQKMGAEPASCVLRERISRYGITRLHLLPALIDSPPQFQLEKLLLAAWALLAHC